MEIWKSECGTYTVILEEKFLNKAHRAALKHFPNEVGSPLVGTYSDNGREARVIGIGPISKDSIGTAFSFTRGVRGLQKYFHKLFQKSGGYTHYVGEWHSHPNGHPIPSGTDEKNMILISKDANMSCPESVLVILALNKNYMNKAVYIYSKTNGRTILTKK